MAILRRGSLLGVCVHHSAVSPAAKNLAELKVRVSSHNNYHKEKSIGWNNTTPGEFGYKYIRYHYCIAYDGSLLQVQDEKYVLYHAGDNFRNDLSFNLHGIAVMLEGNYEVEKPNEKQMLTLVKLIRDIEKRYKIDAKVRGHKETSATATACPGKNIGTYNSGWLKQVIANVNDPNYPTTVKPPTPPEAPGQMECEKEVTKLKEKLLALESTTEALEAEKEALITQNVELHRDISSLEQELLEKKVKLGDLSQKYDLLKTNYDRIEGERLDLVRQLKECKEDSESQMVSSFKMFIEDLLQKLGLLKK